MQHHKGNQEQFWLFLGVATHLIQDSFSAAHTVRNTDQAITEFCKFGTHE